jgi:1,2-diacylglycerol 3-alpha-glucosyltransferase
MKIGMMTNAYKPHVSGVTNYISLHKKFLENAGHEVYVFTFGEEQTQSTEKNIIYSPGIPLIDTGFYINLRFTREVRQLLYTMDVVHLHHPFLIGPLALSYCKPRNIPILFTNHTRYDLYTQAYVHGLPEGTGEIAMHAYLPIFCRSCNMVATPTESIRQILVRFGVDSPIEVIPNGVDLEPFRNASMPFHRESLGLSSKHIVLTFVGRLAPEKNIIFLLRAFNGVCSVIDNVKLLIIGDGPERENLEDRVKHMGIEQRVIFTGMIPYEQIPNYLAISDAGVTASVTETFGFSVVEAMASGLPVLGIDSPGIVDIIKDQKNGLLASNDLASFTAKMMRLVEDHDLREKMGKTAYESVESYEIKHITQILIDHYQDLVENSLARRRSMRNRIARYFDRWL